MGPRICAVPTRRDHGFWPYLAPYLGFLLLADLSGRFPDRFAGAALVLRVLVPLGALLYFARDRSNYPELRRFAGGVAGGLLDFGVGLFGAALWMAPYLLWPSLRPGSDAAFDPELMGPSLVPLVLLLRTLGYGLVTPVMEELFLRSWLPRYVEVFDRRADFRSIPLARYTPRSFAACGICFVITHLPWEWWVAVPWFLLSQLWFYRRAQLGSVVLLHAGSNLGILAAVVIADWLGVGDWWFFV
jgi:CAAX prenyl protease-like protein